MCVIGTIIISILGYLVGAFSFSITIYKIKTKKDIRNYGSKNAGATNVSRMLGKKWGVLILILDASKVIFIAFVAYAFTYIPHEAFNKTSFYIPALFTLIGHCYPVYYKFKGGKAVSCFLGITLVTNWIIFLVFFCVFIILLLTFRTISVCSIVSALVAVVMIWIPQISGGEVFTINGNEFFENNSNLFVWMNKFHTNSLPNYYESFLTICIVITIAALVLITRHHQNIKRLIKNEEPKFFNYRRKTKQEEEKEASNKEA
ncbi:glycerol-3-phosphate acyltransferase PlsY [Spiroplasma helicoides]|uniref:Glycerol-3-phosphate acyltransferase n=1 Tax=Spiroplasma helicoides TaxID=216938 RepID=A0A1B3SKT0_9MOLU|nr:glycerol-3-phosphate 1-O-acyltransferase PlsY [Spiroplasma helicoides]AOG60527.1 glycerol-3-phosphate acyltransferase PlsY [Spiroplasma helicoides]